MSSYLDKCCLISNRADQLIFGINYHDPLGFSMLNRENDLGLTIDKIIPNPKKENYLFLLVCVPMAIGCIYIYIYLN